MRGLAPELRPPNEQAPATGMLLLADDAVIADLQTSPPIGRASPIT
jgi:hypothetical protein